MSTVVLKCDFETTIYITTNRSKLCVTDARGSPAEEAIVEFHSSPQVIQDSRMSWTHASQSLLSPPNLLRAQAQSSRAAITGLKSHNAQARFRPPNNNYPRRGEGCRRYSKRGPAIDTRACSSSTCRLRALVSRSTITLKKCATSERALFWADPTPMR